jgi:hypothetical protein
MNSFLIVCGQEEEKLKMAKSECFVEIERNNTSQGKQKGKGKISPQCEIKKELKCFFCKNKGHIKKDFP